MSECKGIKIRYHLVCQGAFIKLFVNFLSEFIQKDLKNLFDIKFLHVRQDTCILSLAAGIQVYF
jgi:hypothetical protein